MKKNNCHLLTRSAILFTVLTICNTAFAQLSAWNYVVPVVITETSGSNLTNYQTLIIVDTETPIGAGKMNVDGSDIRFAADIAGTTILNFWVDTGLNTTTTEIWVKVPGIPASGTATIYLFYGNSSALPASNGDSTFMFFEDFSSGSISSSKWAISPGTGGDVTSVINGYASIIDDGTQGLKVPQTLSSFAQPFILDLKFQYRFTGENNHYGFILSDGFQSMGTYSGAVAGNHSSSSCLDNDIVEIIFGASSDAPSSSSQYTDDDCLSPFKWHDFETKISSSTMAMNVDGMVYEAGQNTGTVGPFYLSLGGYWDQQPWSIYGGSETWHDDIRIRQYSSSEPTIAVGTESLVSSIFVNGGSICTGDSITLTVVIDTSTSLTPPYTYAWTPTTDLSCTTCDSTWASPTVTTVYQVIVTDSSGVMDSTSAIVTVSSSLPTANAGADTSFCEGNSVQLNGSGGVTHTWSPGTGLSDSTIANPVASPLATTNYILTASNGCGTDADTVTVSIDPLPIILYSDTSLCQGGSVQLAATGAVTYAWSPGNTLDDSTIASPYATPSATTSYSLTATSSMGCILNDTVSVTVDSVPQLVASASRDSICLGDTTQLNVSGDCSGGSGQTVTYSENFIGGSSYTAGSPQYDNWIAFRAQLDTSVHDFASVTIKGTNDPTGITCSDPVTVNLIAEALRSGNPGVSYTWGGVTWRVGDCGGGTELNANNTGTDCNCTNTSSTYCVRPAVGAGDWGGINGLTCNASTQTLTVEFISAPCNILDSTAIYTWSPSLGLSDPSIANPTANPTATTTYTVNVDEGGCLNTDSITVYVDTVNTISVSADTAICAGDSVQLNASGASSYDWSPAAGLSCNNCPNPVAGPLADITYRVTSPAGCAPSDSIFVEVNGASPQAYSFSPDPKQGTGTFDACGISNTDDYIDWVELSSVNANTIHVKIKWFPSVTGTWTTNNGIHLKALHYDGTAWTEIYSHLMSPSDFTASVFQYDEFDFNLPVGAQTGIHYIRAMLIDRASTLDSIPIGTTCADGSSGTAGGSSRHFDNDDVSFDAAYGTFVASSTQDTICLGDTIQFQVYNGDSSWVYNWNPGTGLSDPNISNPMASPTNTTKYVLTVVDNNCTFYDSITVYVDTVNTIAVSADTSLCVGDSVQLNASGASSYNWSPATGLSCTNCSNPVAGPLTDVTYYVTSSAACAPSDSVFVEVNGGVPVTATATPSNLCFPTDTVQLEVSGSADISDNFDPTIDGAVWTTVAGAAPSLGCGSVSGNALYFDGTIRYAETVDMNVTVGGTVDFWLMYGKNGSAPCELLNAADEVDLDYSVDGGLSWVNISTYSNTLYATFTFLSETIPPAAQTGTTRFRWNQPTFSGAVYDHWSIDDMAINTIGGTLDSTAIFNWSPGATLDDSTSITPIAVPGGQMTYVVTVDDQGCVATDTITVYIDATVITTTSDTAICQGNSGVIGVTSNTPTASYLWSPATGLSDTTAQFPTASPTSTTTYYVDVTNTAGCMYTDSVVMTIDTAPTASFTEASTDLTVTFTNTSIVGTSYNWDFGDGFLATVANPVHTYNSNGTYNVCLTASNACGSDTMCDSVTVAACAPVIAAFNYSDSLLTVDFTDTSTDATSWNWDFGDASTSTDQNPVHTYPADGTYNVCLVTTNACSSDTVCVMVTITSSVPCTPTIAGFTSNSVDLDAVFTDASSDATSWSWDFGDASTSTDQNPVHTYAADGTYNVCLTTTNTCSSDMSCMNVIVADSSCTPATAAFTSAPSELTVAFTDASTDCTEPILYL